MSHHKHFTEEQLTDRFDFNSKLKIPLFILMAVGLLFVLIGLFTATDPGADDHGHDAHAEEGHGGDHGHSTFKMGFNFCKPFFDRFYFVTFWC